MVYICDEKDKLIKVQPGIIMIFNKHTQNITVFYQKGETLKQLYWRSETESVKDGSIKLGLIHEAADFLNFVSVEAKNQNGALKIIDNPIEIKVLIQ